MTIGILTVLVITNASWFAISKHSGSFVGLIFYAFIAFICWRRKRFQAGIIGGIIGLVIHIYELLFQGLSGFTKFESGLFFINLILPILLIYFSYKSYKKFRNI